MLSKEMKRQLLKILGDDISKGDVTSALIPKRQCRVLVVAKEPCVLAGLEEAVFLFRSKKVKARPFARDGQRIARGRKVLELKGLNKSVLAVERTALNVLGRMSGVASACSEAKRIAGKNVVVALTRKTMPGFNLFDNKAGSIGGAWTHRINLNSFVLLKDNHIPFFKSPSDAVLAARKRYGKRKMVDIEVESLEDALDAAAAKPDIIMLDNFSPSRARSVIKKLRPVFRGKIELSGGINLENLKSFASAKPDIVSIGGLTHGVKSKNFSAEFKE